MKLSRGIVRAGSRALSIVSQDRGGKMMMPGGGTKMPMVPEATKLMLRAQTLVQDKYMMEDEYSQADKLAATIAKVDKDGEIEIDGEKLNALRKIVMDAMEKRKAHAEEAQQQRESHIKDTEASHPSSMAAPKAPKGGPEGMCVIL